MPNKKLVATIARTLKKYQYKRGNTLLVTSLCSDEVNRVLEEDFAKVYKDHFNIGGLAGFPFGGTTGFGNMAKHIPDGGSCLVVFGPHVGVSSNGFVGEVERRGRDSVGPCCDQAVFASNYVHSIFRNETIPTPLPTSPFLDLDAQQNLVNRMLLPHAARLDQAAEKMVELPFALYDAQKEMMNSIVQAACFNVADDGKIALLGGIQINTPTGTSDFFLPLSLVLYDNKGCIVEDLLSSIVD
jgi:Limiting CO2-inducible proteins B/C beta carbonyic anhydrases